MPVHVRLAAPGTTVPALVTVAMPAPTLVPSEAELPLIKDVEFPVKDYAIEAIAAFGWNGSIATKSSALPAAAACCRLTRFLDSYAILVNMNPIAHFLGAGSGFQAAQKPIHQNSVRAQEKRVKRQKAIARFRKLERIQNLQKLSTRSINARMNKSAQQHFGEPRIVPRLEGDDDSQSQLSLCDRRNSAVLRLLFSLPLGGCNRAAYQR